MQKLAIILTHPIQYYAPLFSLLHRHNKLKIKVFYTWERGSESFDRGFGKNVAWDIPLLEGYEYHFVSNNGRMGRKFWQIRNSTLNKEIKEWNADAVLVFGWNYWSHLRALMYFKGKIPVLFRGDSHLLSQNSPWKNLLRKIWLSWVYRHIDYALYVGTNNKNYYLKFGLKEEQLVFAPHAIDNDRFFDTPTRSYELQAEKRRNDLNYKKDNIVFMFIGKLESIKNPILLLKAFKNLSSKHVRLLFVGDGNLEATLKEMASDDSRIKFLGFQNQSVMPELYRVADVIVLPSIGETWGLVINEAMASGTPVLVSDKVGCAADLVQSGRTGWVFKSNEIVDLQQKMELFLSHSIESRTNLSKNTLSLISAWNFEAIAKSVNQILCKPLN